jgi:hypothetical protein
VRRQWPSSVGIAISPLAGGWLFDSFGVYDWIYIGSMLIRFAAVAVALAFPPFPSRQTAAAQPA